MRKSYKIFMLIAITFLTLFSLNVGTSAETISDIDSEMKELEKKQSELEKKRKKIDQEKDSIKGKKDENLKEQDDIQAQLNQITDKLNRTEVEISEVESDIAINENEIRTLNVQIKKLDSEIKELEKRIKQRMELLKDRLRSLQETGGFSKYIAVLLGATDFGDFISRSSSVSTIMDSDKQIMRELEEDQEALEKKQTEVEEKRKSVKAKKKELEKQKNVLSGLKDDLKGQKKEQEKIKKKLAKEYEELEMAELSASEESELISSDAKYIEEAKKMLANKKSKIEEERKAEEARKAQEESNSNNSGNNGNNVNQTPNPPAGNARFIWPIEGNFNPNQSSYGWRIHPIHGDRRHHDGLDISPIPSGSNLPILAADDGIVSFAGVRGGYGNTVMIQHGDMTTLYAHLSSINVSAGQKVQQGQKIGNMGTTGTSTGVHLHFEVHPGSYKNPTDPRNYLP